MVLIAPGIVGNKPACPTSTQRMTEECRCTDVERVDQVGFEDVIPVAAICEVIVRFAITF